MREVDRERPDRRGSNPAAGLSHFLLLSYFVALINTAFMLDGRVLTHAGVAVYSAVLTLTYTFIYLLPSIVLTQLARLVLWRRGGRTARALLVVCAVVLTGLTQILIYCDRQIFDLFGFHINGFVWNLVTTPGGIESLGASTGAKVYFAAVFVGFLALQAAAAFLAFRRSFAPRWMSSFTRKRYAWLLLLFFVGTGLERAAYGISDVCSFTPLLTVTDSFPLYLRMSVRSLARQLGFKASRHDTESLEIEWSRLNYPLTPLTIEPPAQLPNIVWLTAESLRADMLDPEIMPATWEFGLDAHRFTQHYSGGYGTRMGMFSLFYGLYGNYWWPFLKERRGPVLLDVLKQLGYTFEIRTSARFTYPEFDKTIFSAISTSQMHEIRKGEGWECDRRNVDRLIKFISDQDRSRPFMAFMFFESAHAKYYFPEESVIRRPYLPDLNYATMDVEQDIELIKNRYINAVHHLDSQLERVIDVLESHGLLENTIVLITGDHGEEFMEKGRWGHNSAYTEEQIRVPLILHVPGTSASVVERMTSHLDVAATVLPLLGVQNPPSDYSLGQSLFGPEQRRYTVIASWSSVCYVDQNYKQTFVFQPRAILDRPEPLRTKEDGILSDDSLIKAGRAARLVQLMREMGRFTTK